MPAQQTIHPDPRSFVLVHLTDARYFAAYSTLNRSYNVRNPELTVATGTGAGQKEANGKIIRRWPWHWNGMIFDMWKRGLPHIAKPTILGSLPPIKPRNFRFVGVNAWDAINQTLEDIYFTVVVDLLGKFRLVSLTGDVELQRPEINLLEKAVDGFMDFEGSHAIQQPLPEYVRVYFPSRDYQFQKDQFSACPADFVNAKPVISRRYQTLKLLGSLSRSNKLTIIKKTEIGIHIDQDADFRQTGQLMLEEQLETAGKTLAASHVKSLAEYNTDTNYIFHGAWPFIPGIKFTAVAWYDTGQGLRTQCVQGARKMHLRARIPELTSNDKAELGGTGGSAGLVQASNLKEETARYPGPPDVAHDEIPYDREIYGVIVKNTPRHFQRHGGDFGTIAHNRIGVAAIQKVEIDYGSGSSRWGIIRQGTSNDLRQVDFVNHTGNDLEVGGLVYLRYNRQAFGRGFWIAIPQADTTVKYGIALQNIEVNCGNVTCSDLPQKPLRSRQ